MPYATPRIGLQDGLSWASRPGLAPLWEDYFTTPVRDRRVLTLSGRTSFSDGRHRVENAVGMLELSGGPAGPYRTTLQICFADALTLPPPSFILGDDSAVGTLALHARYFDAYIEVASRHGAHFRIGGDGARNALAADLAQLG